MHPFPFSAALAKYQKVDMKNWIIVLIQRTHTDSATDIWSTVALHAGL